MVSKHLRFIRTVFVVALAALVVIPATPASAYVRPGRTERVPGGPDGSLATDAVALAMTPDGRYIAFRSSAPNLVSGDSGSSHDVFVTDRLTGTIERVSVASDGTPGNWYADEPYISSDGRFIAFPSGSTNLVPGDTNSARDAFVHDRVTGLTERVSVASDGTQINQAVGSISMSADGRYVTFSTNATNLTADGNGGVFLHDRETKTTERIVGCDGGYAQISQNGRYVVFIRGYADAVPPCSLHSLPNVTPLSPAPLAGLATPPHLRGGVAVFDRETGDTEVLPLTRKGNWAEYFPSISANGRYVVFASDSSNLVPSDTNGTTDVFVYDRTLSRMERVSAGSNGQEPNSNSWTGARLPSISDDGRFVTFASKASNLVPGDTNNAYDMFVRDRLTGSLERVNLSGDGEQEVGGFIWSAGWVPVISGDGRYIAYVSSASNLAPGDTNNGPDIFVRDRGPSEGIGDMNVVAGAEDVNVQGWATFDGTAMAKDEAPNGSPALGPAGAEITGATLSYRPDSGDLQARVHLLELPAAPAPAPPAGGHPVSGVLYTLSFELEGIRYEVRMQGAGGALPTDPYFDLFRCQSSCTEVGRLEGAFGTAGDEVSAAVPSSMLHMDTGALTNVRAFSALGTVANGAGRELDSLAVANAELAAPAVQLGIAPAGTSQETVDYGNPVELTDGRFTGSIDVTSLASGEYDVWAKACLGGSCGASKVPIDIHKPEPAHALLDFTAESGLSGQYSDPTSFVVRLTDAAGNALEGEQVTFALGDSSSSYTSTTDADGIARIAPTLSDRPGTYQLTARFAGSDRFQAVTATRTFSVTRERTVLALELRKRRALLIGRLADHDDLESGIARRTIKFFVDGRRIGRVTTGAEGRARIKFPTRYRRGHHRFETRFVGDGYYRPSMTRKRT